MTSLDHAKLMIGDLVLTVARLTAENEAMHAVLTPEQIAQIKQQQNVKPDATPR